MVAVANFPMTVAGRRLFWPTRQVASAHLIFSAASLAMFWGIAEQGISSIYTISGMLQGFAVLLLAWQAAREKSFQGISPASLLLNTLCFCLRLSSTTWLNGYVPNDPSGDWFYQACDVAALAVAFCLLCGVLVRLRWATAKQLQNTGEDMRNLLFMIPVCFVLGISCHGDMNDRPVFDALWTAGTFMGIAAVLPQFWQTQKGTARPAESLEPHAIIAMCISQILSGAYFWYARHDVTYVPWSSAPEFSYPVWSILGGHFVTLYTICDFNPSHEETE
jgi:hypothetical protein